jgi:hypothetical protein
MKKHQQGRNGRKFVLSLVKPKLPNLMKKLLILFFLLAFSFQSLACRCIQRSFEEHTEDADMIFSGEVIEVEQVGNQSRYVLKISQSWKGEPEEETIEIFSHNGSCHVHLELNHSYILFAENQKISLCSKVEEADDEETQLLLNDYFEE